MKYEQTVGGYFYKIYSNGNRKRVSKEVFDKNVMKGGAGGRLVDRVKSNIIYEIRIFAQSDNYPLPSNIDTMDIKQLRELLEFYTIRHTIKLYKNEGDYLLPNNFNSMNIEQLKVLRDRMSSGEYRNSKLNLQYK